MKTSAAALARRVFTVDVRSLAVMRIAVALTVITDLVARGFHLFEHYSDDGVLPRSAARVVSSLSDASLLALSGSKPWVAIVFAGAFALSAAVLSGWRTRVSTLLLWVVMLSIQHRNPLVCDHRDALISCSLFWGSLLPWGEALSLDARRRVRVGRLYTGVAAAGYVVQVACVYLFAAALKDGPEWRSDHTAVARALSLEYWAQPASKLVLVHESLTAALTVAVLWGEAAIGLLLLCPWRIARWLAVVGICAMQLGFGAFLWLDTFPMIAIAMALGLLPASGPLGAEQFEIEPSRSVTAASAVALVCSLTLNVVSLTKSERSLEVVEGPARLFGLQQNWNMFAPSPTRVDGWFVVASRGADGTAVDLLTGRAVDWSRPRSFREGIRTTRELVYMRRLLAVDDVRRESFAAARCRSQRPAASIAVYFVPVIDRQVEAPELLVEQQCP